LLWIGTPDYPGFIHFALRYHGFVLWIGSLPARIIFSLNSTLDIALRLEGSFHNLGIAWHDPCVAWGPWGMRF